MPEKNLFKDSVLRVVAIIGLIAILLLGAWGIIQLSVALPNFFGGTGNSASPVAQTSEQEGVSVVAPSIINTGVSFTVSWNHTNASPSDNYGFIVSYSCANGLTMLVPVPTGSTREIPCNTPFNFINATADMQLTPKLTGTQQAVTTIFVAANRLSDGKITSVGSSTTTVLPARAVQTSAQSATPAPSSMYVSASNPRTNLYGLPDLSVRILSAIPVNGRYSVQFAIGNNGTNIVPSGWTFDALLPLNPAYTFVSQPQQALYPGDKIVYTIGFDIPVAANYYNNYPTTSQYPYSSTYPYPSNCGYGTNYTYDGVQNYPTTSNTCGTNYYNSSTYYNQTYPNYGNYSNPSYYGSSGVFSVTVDPQGVIQESNKGNNTASVTLSN